jgi:PAS domain S-box-containing protein
LTAVVSPVAARGRGDYTHAPPRLRVNRQPGPNPAVRATLREALTAGRESFRRTVGRLADEHGFDADRLATEPATFDPPAAVGPVDPPHRRPTWRAWTLDDAPLGVVLTGAAYHDNPVLYANRATCRLTGYSLAALAGGNLRRLQGPGTDRSAVASLRDALRGWDGVTVELRNYRADGTPFTNRVSLVPVPDDTGTVEHWFGLQAVVSEE